MVSQLSSLSKQTFRSILLPLAIIKPHVPFKLFLEAFKAAKIREQWTWRRYSNCQSLSYSISEILACIFSLAQQECCYKNTLGAMAGLEISRTKLQLLIAQVHSCLHSFTVFRNAFMVKFSHTAPSQPCFNFDK